MLPMDNGCGTCHNRLLYLIYLCQDKFEGFAFSSSRNRTFTFIRREYFFIFDFSHLG